MFDTICALLPCLQCAVASGDMYLLVLLIFYKDRHLPSVLLSLIGYNICN